MSVIELPLVAKEDYRRSQRAEHSQRKSSWTKGEMAGVNNIQISSNSVEIQPDESQS